MGVIPVIIFAQICWVMSMDEFSTHSHLILFSYFLPRKVCEREGWKQEEGKEVQVRVGEKVDW